MPSSEQAIDNDGRVEGLTANAAGGAGTQSGARRVTVMIPSYNYAHYLPECVQSALDQPGVDVDVLIVDNASTDGSLAIAQALADQHPNIRLVTYPDNQGIVCSLNRCFAGIEGEYAVLLCADDRLVPGALSRAVDLLQTHPTVGLVYGPALDFAAIDDVDPKVYAKAVQTPAIYPGESWINARCHAGTNPIRTPEVTMRSSVVKSVGPLDPRCTHTSDFNLWLRIAAVADVAFLPGPPLALYRRHATNHSNIYNFSMHLDLSERWRAFESFFEKLDGHPQRPAWERAARARIARDSRYFALRAYVHGPDAQGDDHVDELQSLADTLQPDRPPTRQTLAWRARPLLGRRLSGVFPPFLIPSVLRRVSRRRAERRRMETGQ